MRVPQVPLNTPILVSKAEPHKLKVVKDPSPAKVYQTPGAVLSVVAHPVTASAVAAAVLPVSVCPQLIVNAPVHKSFAGGGSVQLVHCTVVVRHEDWDPQPGVFQCANKVPVYVFANTNGVVPDATTGPLEVPERTVIKSVAILLVKLNVWPLTAPLIVEYSPAKEHVEIVTKVPDGLIVAVPNEEVFVH